MRWARLAAGVGVLLAACDAPSPWGVSRARLGQPIGDFPNYDERVVLYAANRARSDPAAEGWAAFPAQPPLQWNHELNRSARAHSQDMHDTPCFQHNSCDGTDLFVRIKSFYKGPWTSMGENISAGRSISDGFVAVHNWIFEIGAPAGETGHRENIFSAKFTLLGAGFVAGGTQFQNYWTQDFVGTNVTRPRLADGIHFPASVAAGGLVTFGTTYYDGGGAAPAQVAVVVDGACAPLSLARGTAARGAYEVKQALPSGCHPYFFLATTGGVAATYPDVGAFQVAVGVSAAACPFAVPARASNGCGADAGAGAGAGAIDGGDPAGGSGGGPGGSGGVGGDDTDAMAGGGSGGTSEPGSGGATAEGSGGSQGAPAPDADATLPPPPDDNSLTSSTFGCAVAGGAATGGAVASWWALLVAGASALLVMRRRGRSTIALAKRG